MFFFILVVSLIANAFATKDAFLQSGAISGDVYSPDDSFSYSLSTTLGDTFYDPITIVSGAVTQPRGGVLGAGACYIIQYTFPTNRTPLYGGGFEYPLPSLASSSKLVPDQAPSIGDNFGTDVSINGKGTLIAVGACSGCVKNIYPGFSFSAGTGKVFIFSITSSKSYVQRAVIVPQDALNGDQFGSSVALASSANVLVACSPQARIGNSYVTAGACYVFTSSSSNLGAWTQVAKLVEPTSTSTNSGNYFGGNCGGAAISGDGKVIVIGAPKSTAGLSNGRVGALYLFRAGNSAFTLWSTGIRLRQQTPYANSQFGYMVTMTNDATTIASGAPYDFIGGVQKGSVEVFYTSSPSSGSYTTSSWVWYQKLSYSGSSQDAFGTGLALSADGNTLSIGAPGKESVYTYTYNDYDSLSKYTFQGADGALYPNNPQGGSQFGFNVKMDSKGFSLFVSAQTDFSQPNSTYFPPLSNNNQPIRSGSLYSFSSGIQPAIISTGSTTSSSSSNQNTGAIIGGIFGPLFAIILFNVFYYMFCDKKPSAPGAQESQEVQAEVNPSAPPPPELKLRTIMPNEAQNGDMNVQQLYGIPPPQPMAYGGIGIPPNPYAQQAAQQQMQYGQYGMQQPQMQMQPQYGMQQPQMQYGMPQQVGYFVTSPSGQQQMVMMPVVQMEPGGQQVMMMEPGGQVVQVQPSSAPQQQH
jgi:hypothetical protein